MKKKILILFVRRGYLEIEYILPVLKILKERYFIYTYFEKKKLLNHCYLKVMFMKSGKK